MELQEKPVTSTGSGATTTPILAGEKDPTAEPLIPSQETTSIELVNFLNARPSTPAEALGLLQTRFFDLQSLKLDVRLAGNPDTGRLYVVIGWKGHKLGVQDGHITVDQIPVLKMESE